MNTFLESLTSELREAIELAASEVRFGKGQAVFNRGDAGLALYIIEKGSVRVHDSDLLLNRLGPGEITMELSAKGGDLIVCLCDKAPAFDAASAAPDEMSPADGRTAPGGFGLYLMKQAMDDIAL